MAEAAETQAGILAKELKPVPAFEPSLRSRLTGVLIDIFGPRAVRHVLSASKVRGVSVYRGKLEDRKATLGRPRPRRSGAATNPMAAARSGRACSASMTGSFPIPAWSWAWPAPRLDASVLILTGVAGLLAGAFSMAAGEFISMLSQKEMFEHQISQEKDELERYPAEEAEELALIYAARGIPIKEARDVAKKLIANPDKALDTLAREELGLNPDDLGSPTGAAISSFLAFSVGASLPIIPFLLGLSPAVAIAAAISGAALFVVGAVLSLFSGKSACLGGLRMFLIGSAAAAATYFIGSLFNVSGL